MSRLPQGILFGLPALVLAVGLCFLAWKWLGEPEPLPEVTGHKVACVSYTPYVGSQSPLKAETQIPPEQIDRDLAHLSRFTDCLRTYGVEQGLAEVPRLARAHGMKVLLGLWLGADLAKNAVQTETVISLANANADVVRAVVVGNEVLLRRDLPAARLGEYLRQVRSRVKVPVTYADVWEFWIRNPELAQDTDFVTVHILPYWEDDPVSVNAAVPHVRAVLDRVRKAFPGRPLLIGETGWPSAGRMRGPALPGRVNQAHFVRSFIAMAGAEGVDYNLIESFDQPWKTALEGTVGGTWGLYDGERQPKFPLSGGVSEHPEWRSRFIFSAILGGLPLLWLLGRGPIPRPLRWFGLAVAAQAAGSLLVLHGEYVMTVNRTWYEWAQGGDRGWCLGAGGLAGPDRSHRKPAAHLPARGFFLGTIRAGRRLASQAPRHLAGGDPVLRRRDHSGSGGRSALPKFSDPDPSDPGGGFPVPCHHRPRALPLPRPLRFHRGTSDGGDHCPGGPGDSRLRGPRQPPGPVVGPHGPGPGPAMPHTNGRFFRPLEPVTTGRRPCGVSLRGD
ncbi:MAG: hypothetical protein ABT940_02555 [Alphaproteobacteria bacterium]